MKTSQPSPQRYRPSWQEEAKRLAKRRAKSLNEPIRDALQAEIQRDRDKLALERCACYAREDPLEAEEGFDEWALNLEKEHRGW